MSTSEQAYSAAADSFALAPPFRLRDFAAESGGAEAEPIRLAIELGRAHMTPDEVTKLTMGSVVAIDRLSADPVDIVAGGRLVGRGVVVVVHDKFSVRVTELVVGGAYRSSLE